MKAQEKEREEWQSVRWVLIAATLLAALCFFGGALDVVFDWGAQNARTSITRRSTQYITSHQMALRQLATQYHDPGLSEAHRNAILRQMRAEADLIPDNVQPDIQNDLNGGLR